MNWSLWYRIVSYSRSSLWIVPLFAIVIEQLVIRAIDRLEGSVKWHFYGVGLAGSQAVMDAIGTLTLSFIVFTFGSLLVAIQVASGQLSPRIIATTLLRDNVVRYSVGMFVFTFVYSMGLRARTETAVPQLGLALCGVLGLGSIAVFLYLIDYAARLLRPISIMAVLGEAGLKVIDEVYTRKTSLSDQEKMQLEKLPERPRQIVYHQGTSGILLAVNLEELLALARKSDSIVELMAQVGDFVGVGEPLFQIYANEVTDEEALRSAVVFGPERTIEQDPLFAFRILVDIGIKALSKAINDPTTAVLAIDQLHRLLRKVGRRQIRTEQIKDDDGKLRVHRRTPTWEDFVLLATAEIRFYGAENVQVARRLRAMLENLIATLPKHRHPALRLELDLLDRTIDKLYAFPEDAATARVADPQGLGGSGVGAS